MLKNLLRLALGRERPITFCLDTKSNKKIKTKKSFHAQGLSMARFSVRLALLNGAHLFL